MSSASVTSVLEEEVDGIVARHSGREGPLLPILHEIQETLGHVPPAAVPRIAKTLNLTAAEVHGVVSFYHDFTDAPRGKHVLKICRSEACQAVGGAEVAEAALRRLGVGWSETTKGGVTVEPVYCLGLCACAPAAMVDGRVVGRVDRARMGEILEEIEA